MTAVSLSRRVLAAGVVSSLAVLGAGVSLAASESPVLPNVGCDTFTDPKGDDSAGKTGDANVNMGNPTGQGFPSDPDVDLTGVVIGGNATALTAYVRVAKLGSGPSGFLGHDFAVDFTAGGKAVELASFRYSQAALDTAGTTSVGPVAGTPEDVVKIAGKATTVKVSATYDTAHSMVIISADRPGLEKALGAPVTTLTALSASSASDVFLDAFFADSAKAPAGFSVKADANACFASAAPSPSATDEPTTAPTTEPSAEPSASATPTESPSETPTAEPAGPPALFDQPRTGCFLFKDAAGDAKPGRAPLTSPNNDADLDLTEVALKSAPDALVVFAKVAKLGSAPTTQVFTGHSFTLALTVGGKALTVTAAKSGAATSNNSGLKATAVLDTKASNVVFTLPTADLQTIAGGPVGDVTAITLTSNATNGAGSFDGDTATGSKPEEKTYAYGDNTCFQPPVGKLALSGATGGVYSDTATVTATLLDTADAAVEGATLSLTLPGQAPLTGTTDAAGIVAFVVPVTVPAGAKTIAVDFLGTDVVGPVSISAPFTVTVEKAVVTAKAGRGTVTATLTDDDKTPLAGQVVTFTVGSKVTKVKTNAKGVATLTRQTKGATVKVGFAAVKDLYSAAKAVTAKVL